MFDLEQIQIQAALQGKITEEERTRLKLMQAIIEENGSEAERLMEQLKKSQEETAKLAKSLTDLKAGNPFRDWDGYTAYALGLVGQIRTGIDDLYRRLNDFLRIEKGVGAGATRGGVTGGDDGGADAAARAAADAAARAAADAAAKAAQEAAAAAAAQKKAYEEAAAKAASDADAIAAAAAAAKAAAEAIAAAEKAARDAAAAAAAATTAEDKASADAFVKGAAGALAAALEERDAADAIADSIADKVASAAAKSAEQIASEAINAIIESSGVMGRVSGESGLLGARAISVVINVQGSVISENDLVEAVTDGLYQNQKTGKGLLYSATVI